MPLPVEVESGDDISSGARFFRDLFEDFVALGIEDEFFAARNAAEFFVVNFFETRLSLDRFEEGVTIVNRPIREAGLGANVSHQMGGERFLGIMPHVDGEDDQPVGEFFFERLCFFAIEDL